LEPLSEISVNSMLAQNTNDFMEAWRCISVGLMAYRQGYTPTAIQWCKRCLSYADQNPNRAATAHIIQAMASYQLNEVDEARSELEVGRKMVEEQFSNGLQEGKGSTGFWYDSLFARILLREAEALIDQPLAPANRPALP
jgi:hypothetical protein